MTRLLSLPIRLLPLFALLLTPLPAALAAADIPPEALELRDLGFAELENERPAEAQAAFEKLLEIVDDDPLGHANLAIALLRQQQFEAAAKALAGGLEIAPGDPRLLAILAEIKQWSGDSDAALEVLRKAAAAAPDDVEIQYALYRVASTLRGDGAEQAGGEALERLARLRPENLVVMTQLGQRAREAGDRAAATAAFLRIRELAWQAPPAAATLLDQVLEALAEGDLEKARVPSLRLENLLKVTAMHRESLRELATGIQGIPIARFADEPSPDGFGKPAKVKFAGTRLSDVAGAGSGLAVADFDNDFAPDLARLVGAKEDTQLEVRRAAGGWAERLTYPAPGATALLAADLDNDGFQDLLTLGASSASVWRGGAEGFTATDFGLVGGGRAAAVIDFDIEGDLDLVTGGERRLELWLNALDGQLAAVGERVFPEEIPAGIHDLAASDLDRDGDLDLVVAHAGGVAWLDNLRQGEFSDRTARSGLAAAPPSRALVSADFDGDGWPDLALAGAGLSFFRNAGGRFEPWEPGGSALASAVEFSSLAALDADNDGRLDLAAAGDKALVVLTFPEGGGVQFLTLDKAPAGATALAARDLDGDGDLDLVTHGAAGLHRLDNQGGNRNGWLSVRLRGLDKGNGKNNLFGLGATLEVRDGRAYQFREAQSDVTHFGLGQVKRADVLRVVWTNGVPQNRLDVTADQALVEEQVLKGSCPFLYVWNGDEIAFVTDLLWGAPAGLPVAPGVYAGADPDELVEVVGATPRDGVYDLRLTEELWEAAFFDHTRLWVVDHPAEVNVASNLRVVPGRKIEDRVLGTRELEPLVRATDGAGRDLTQRLAERDEVYADAWRESAYQGVAAEPWELVFDLGRAPAAPLRLHLEGWIFPTDASLNIALAQRGYRPLGPLLEVETNDGWQPLVTEMGFPAGKTKTMVVDTPALPEGARRLRIVSTLWLSWDRIRWSTRPADDEPRVVARLAPATAELRYRGFSALRRAAPNAPHVYDYADTRLDSPWLPFPGNYTRYGDVRELLESADDRSVILAAGDELALTFDAGGLAPPPPGWRRTLFLESHGWDKDADRNTWEPQRLEPLPFRAMSGYPYGDGESFPDGPVYRDYRERWLTRTVEPEPTGRR